MYNETWHETACVNSKLLTPSKCFRDFRQLYKIYLMWIWILFWIPFVTQRKITFGSILAKPERRLRDEVEIVFSLCGAFWLSSMTPANILGILSIQNFKYKIMWHLSIYLTYNCRCEFYNSNCYFTFRVLSRCKCYMRRKVIAKHLASSGDLSLIKPPVFAGLFILRHDVITGIFQYLFFI